MALVQIPFSGVEPDETLTVILEGRSYDLRIQYNPRDESWYMYFGLQNLPAKFKTKIRTGVNILENFNAYDDVPKGDLRVVDLNKLYGRIQRDSFSSGRMVLLYLTEASKAATDEFFAFVEATLFDSEVMQITVDTVTDGRFTVG